MKVICINDKNLPNEIPVSKRIKLGAVYTVVNTIKCNIQNGAIAFVLEEIQLGLDELPYKGFSAHRFAVDVSSLVHERMQEPEPAEMA
jgi:hypothetical protein